MRKGKIERVTTGSLVTEIDAAIALLTRVRAMAVSNDTPQGMIAIAKKQAVASRPIKRVLSAEAREAMATAQKERWAKVRRLKKQAERAAMAR